MKFNLMTFEFNVDRFYAQLGAFSIFTISHIREMKPGSNWIPWPMNLMLTDFTPNWALFLFPSIHMIEGWNLDQIESHDVNLMLTDFTSNWVLFLFSLFYTKEGSKSQKKRQGMCHLDDTALSSFFFSSVHTDNDPMTTLFSKHCNEFDQKKNK